MIKIVQINAVNEYSSTGRTTTELHQYLLSQGVDSYVAAMNIQQPTERLLRVGNPWSWRIHSFLSHLLGRQGHYSYFATRRLIRQIDSIKPNVVHLRNLHSNFIHLPLLLKYLGKNNIPTVLTLHDFWFLTGHCCYFTDRNCQRWKTGCGHCPDLRNWNRSWIFDCTHRNLTDKQRLFSGINHLAVIGVSEWVTGYVHESILKNAQVIRTIYNWVDTDVFSPQSDAIELRSKLCLTKDDFVILGVAQNWTPTKGISDFVQLAKARPQYKVVLVGGTSDIHEKLPQNVILAGTTDSVKQLATYYSMGDVFFNPTTRETFGKVTVEAQSCGTPVIAYNSTATPELIASGCGFVLKEHDMTHVISACDDIHRKGKKHYADKCRQSIMEKFDKNVLMKQYLELYEHLTLSV